ncbi:MAG: LamG-like jellyroll fold domain-containing protein, partial [Planctomycetota bacterium]
MERKACAVSCVALMLALVWARISAGSIFLTVNEEDVGFIWLPSGGSCTIEVVSDDSSFYSAYLDYSLVQGDFWHVETRPEAGEYASAGDLGDAYELVASGLTPPPSAGIHFVFQYYGSLAPVEDELTLWDDSYAVILDTVEIFVGSGPPEDIDPPTPDPMTWSSTPRALNSSQITMTATTAWDPCGVEYYFDCNCWGGHDSGWQEESVYTDTSLQPGTEYSYRVKARDQSANQNETAWSGAASAATANDIYVDDNAPNDPGSGDPCVSDPLEDGSLEHPFDAIQEAINGASNGDTVIVLPGTYTGTGNRAIDFWGKAITVRGQTGAEDCVVDCQWAARGFYFHLGEEANSVVEGLTITNGYADPGGAIYCGSSSPTIVNCRLVDNEAGSPGGGGIYCVYSNAAISRCSFSGNRTDYNGGGLFSRYGHPTVINCAFSGNYAGMSGGGINNYQAADPPTSPLFENCLFYENIADDYGGGLCNRYSEPNIVGCIFLDNAASAGGGIEIVYADSIRLANCTFGGNAVALNGGAVDVYTSCVTLANCTIADNWANVYGGAIVCSSYNSVSSLTVNNCILWGNTAGTNGAQIALRDGQMYSTMTVSYSDVEGGQPGAHVEPNSTLVWDVGNIDVDPCFFKGYDSDYHLRAESLCINAGDPNGYYGGQTDIDGEPRKMGSEVDMGSDEVFATAPGLLVWYRFEDYQWPIVAENSGSFGSRGTGYLMPDCPNCPAWVWPGYSSSYALQFDGIDDYVEIPALNLNTNTMTISAWVKGDGPQAAYTGIVSSRDQTTSDGTGLAYGSSGQAGGWQANQELCYYWNDDYRQWRSGLYIPADEWAFVGFAVEPSRATLYLDDGTFYCATNVASHGRLEQFDSGSLSQIAHDDMHEHFQGLIDDVRIYNRALSAEEVASIAGADLTRAWDPSPASGAMGAAADTVLTWRPGLWAADTNGHDVYFGLNGWLVNSRDPSAYIGRLDANSFDPPGGLELGLTYYWAVDEVNDSHPNSPWQGPTWSFTVHNIYYVDVNAWGTNDGSSWTDAFGDLQDALDVAQEGDQIRVAEGIYRPSERTDPCYPRTATFQLIDGVATYGGFPSRGSNWDGRDPDSYETILSGDLDGNDVEVLDPCDLLNESTRAENAYHVVTGIGAGATTVLDGFTITGGNANGPFPHYNGAGMTCAVVINYEFASGGSPTVSNCRFTEGSASHDGGGISYCGGSIANCTFTHNFADDDGGALHFCSGPVVDCNISGNAAYHCGGGLYKCSGSLTDSVITGNYSGGWGGGIYNSYEGGY